jgi:hypothetical protein
MAAVTLYAVRNELVPVDVIGQPLNFDDVPS